MSSLNDGAPKVCDNSEEESYTGPGARTIRGAGRAGRVTRSRSRGPKRTQPSTPPLAFAFASSVACGSAALLRTSSRIRRVTSGSTNTFPAYRKVRDIIGLYLSPPDRALVLCVDEKSQIQALDRSQPVLPMLPAATARSQAGSWSVANTGRARSPAPGRR